MIALITEVIGLIKGLPLVWQIMCICTAFCIAAIICFWYCRHQNARYRVMYHKTKVRIDLISEHLIVPGLSSELQQILKDEREEQIFKHVFEYSIPKPLRDALLPVVQAVDSPVHWSAIRDARQFLSIDKDKRLIVNIDGFPKVDYYLKCSLTVVMLLCAILSTIECMRATTQSDQTAFLLLMCIAVVIAAITIASTWGYLKARSIGKWLNSRSS